MSRRGENIHKRKDGRWEARYEKGRTEKGTIIYGFLYGKSYREAKAKKLQALQKQMPMQRSKNYSAFQIQELSSLWLEYVHFNLKESTYMCYAALVQKHIVPYFKKNPQQLLSKNGLQIFYNAKIASGLSTQSVKMILMLLERILAFSEEQELLPTVKRTKVHPKTIPFEKDLLSPEELSLLSRHLAEADTAFAAGVLLCMYTGIRIGELCGIKEKHGFVCNENGFSYIGLNPEDEVIKATLDMYLNMSQKGRKHYQEMLLSHDLRGGRKRVMSLIKGL